jgi:hypothetical protein
MTPSPAGKALIAHEEAKEATLNYFRSKMPKNPTLDDILAECRALYELTKIEHHDGRVSWEHLEKIRRQLEVVEASAAKRKAHS